MNPPPGTHSSCERVLIACIGNIFLGDDGFGVEVARQLQQRAYHYPAGVQIVDFGIRGLDLAFTLLEDYDALVLVDAVPRGGQTGTLYLIEPELDDVTSEAGTIAGRIALETHSMDPLKVLAFARSLGARSIRTLLIGCEPAEISLETSYAEMQPGLSLPVQAAIGGAIQILDKLVSELLASELPASELLASELPAPSKEEDRGDALSLRGGRMEAKLHSPIPIRGSAPEGGSVGERCLGLLPCHYPL